MHIRTYICMPISFARHVHMYVCVHTCTCTYILNLEKLLNYSHVRSMIQVCGGRPVEKARLNGAVLDWITVY